MTYNTIKSLVSRKYNHVTDENGITYFVNKSGYVVATENTQHNLLVMYVYSDSRTVWNHKDTVAVAIAKDFKLVHNYEVRIADVLVMKGLCGATNTIERTSNMLLKGTSSGNVGFKDEYYKPQNATTMGHMISSTKISLDIGLEIDMSTLVRKKDSYKHTHLLDFDNLVYGILNYKTPSRKNKKKNIIKKIQPKDYKIYNYLRKSESWYWENGFNTAGSSDTRKAIADLKYGTNYHKIAKVAVCNSH